MHAKAETCAYRFSIAAQDGRRCLALTNTSQKTKNPNSRKSGIEDCTRLTWSSGGRGPVTRSPVRPLTGRSSGSWIILLPAPSRSLAPVALPVSSPITAAGPRRICTVFPFHPRGGLQVVLCYPVRPGSVKGNRRGSGRTRRCAAPPPGPGPPGRIWPGAGNRAWGPARWLRVSKWPMPLARMSCAAAQTVPERRGWPGPFPGQRCGPRCRLPAPGLPPGRRPPGPPG